VEGGDTKKHLTIAEKQNTITTYNILILIEISAFVTYSCYDGLIGIFSSIVIVIETKPLPKK